MTRLGAVAIVLTLSAFASPTPGGESAGQPMIGEEAPAFRLPALQGGLLALEDLRGKYVVLHFGASW